MSSPFPDLHNKSCVTAIVLTLMPEALRNYLTPWTASALQTVHLTGAAAWVKGLDIEKWRMVLYSLFIILAMLFMPRGLFGRYEFTDLARWVMRKFGWKPPEQGRGRLRR